MGYYTVVQLPPPDLIEADKKKKPDQRGYSDDVLRLALAVKGWSFVVTRNDTDAPVCVCESQRDAERMEMLLNDKPQV
jgi:hypothetical protein